MSNKLGISEIKNIKPIQTNAEKILNSNTTKIAKIVIISVIVIIVLVSFSLGIY